MTNETMSRPRRRRRRGSQGQPCGARRGSANRPRCRTLADAATSLLLVAADDIRDPDGLLRPLLRRAADRSSTGRVRPVGRLGGAYVRLDPPPFEPSEIIDGDAVELPEETRDEAPGRQA